MSVGLRIAMMALVLLAGGCPAEAPPPVVPVQPPAHPADAFDAARYLPDSTAAFVSAPSLKSLLETVNYAQFRRAFPETFERLAFTIAERTGLSLLDPGSLAEIGVALDQPAGVAFPSLRRDEELQPVIFLTLADPSRFKAALYRALAPTQRADLEVVGEAVVLHGDGFSVVLRGRLAMVVAGYGEPLAQTIALQPDATSLAHHGGFRASLGAVEPATVMGYLDLRGMIYAEAGLDPRWSGTDLAAALRDLDERHAAALERARQGGSDATAIVGIDRDFRRAREELADEEGALRLRAMVGSIEGAGLALRLEPTGAALEAVVLMGEHAPLRGLFASGSPCPASSLPGERAVSIEAHLDLGAAQTVAGDWAPAEELLAALALVDVPRDAFDGRFCAAVALPSEGFAAVEDPTDLDFVVRVGLRKPELVRAALGRLGEIPGVPELRTSGDRFSLHLGDRAVTVAIEGSSLVATTRPPRAGASPRATLEAWRSVEAPEPRALGIAFELGLLLLAEGPRSSEVVARRHDPSVAQSEAYAQKRAELDAAEKALAEAWRASVRTSRLDFADRAAGLGAVAFVLKPVKKGVRVEARWSVRAPNVIDALAALETTPELDPWADPTLVPLLERRTQLERELDQLYVEPPEPSEVEEP